MNGIDIMQQEKAVRIIRAVCVGFAFFFVAIFVLMGVAGGRIPNVSASNLLTLALSFCVPLLLGFGLISVLKQYNVTPQKINRENKVDDYSKMPSICPRCGQSIGFFNWRGWDSKIVGCRICSSTIKSYIRKSFHDIHGDNSLSAEKLTRFKSAANDYDIDSNVALEIVHRDVLHVFRQSFLQICANGVAPVSKIGQLRNNVAAYGIDSSEALAFVQKDTLNLFRRAFLRVYADGVTSPTKEAELEDIARTYKLSITEALSFVRTDAEALLRRAFRRIYEDKSSYALKLSALRRTAVTLGIGFDEALVVVRREAIQLLVDIEQAQRASNFTDSGAEQEMRQLQNDLNIPSFDALPIFERFSYHRNIANIRRGILPKIIPDGGLYLDSDETCHFDTTATYHKMTPSTIKLIDGRLLATNKKLRFLSDEGGFEINWGKIMRIERKIGSIYLELSTKTGQGQYDVPDVELAEAILDVLVRIAKRQVASSPTRHDNRHIPQNVKTAVWQRDRGRCVQCGSTSNLQFDHIIPYSKGGSNTETNIQLLCQTCNLAKSDRI